MAITKERLQELINEGATIWGRNDYQTYEINTSYFVNIDIIGDVLYCGAEMVYLDYLYETKEQAEWSLKYHATRTEGLELPTWEEFINQNKPIRFCGEDWEVYELRLALDKSEIYLDEVGEYEMYEQDMWEATEKNYIKACDLCIKLFKGEEE